MLARADCVGRGEGLSVALYTLAARPFHRGSSTRSMEGPDRQQALAW